MAANAILHATATVGGTDAERQLSKTAGAVCIGRNAMTRHFAAAAAVGIAIALTLGASAEAAEVRLLISNALKTTMEELAPQFEKATEHKLSMAGGHAKTGCVDCHAKGKDLTAAVACSACHRSSTPMRNGSTEPLKARIEKGETVDFAIVGDAAMDDLVKQGKLVAGTRVVIARSGLGVAIRKGTPKPDLGTTEAFKRALMNAKSIAYNENGLTGIYLTGLFQRLGIAEEVKRRFKNGSGAELVAKGGAEIGMAQASEISPVAGAELAGPLPEDIQSYTIFPGAVSASAKQADAARALIKFLASPEALRVMKAKGLAPPG